MQSWTGSELEVLATPNMQSPTFIYDAFLGKA